MEQERIAGMTIFQKLQKDFCSASEKLYEEYRPATSRHLSSQCGAEIANVITLGE